MPKNNYIKDKRTGQLKGSYPQKVSPTEILMQNKIVEQDKIEVEFFCGENYDVLYRRYEEHTAVYSGGEFPLLYDILDQDEYEESLRQGHIRIQSHPEYPYLIHNYTESCTWEQGWNKSTLTCRGLITHAATGEVLARPFPKFFNHDQPEAPSFDLDEEVVVMDKVDGSLAVSYIKPDGSLGLATRGSFTSDQAVWANDLYNRKYSEFSADPKLTYLFEIIYPENRVVLDYGDTEDLILLGAVDIRTGRSVHVEELKGNWTGPTVEVFPHTTLREVLESPDRDNAEGFVLWHPERDERVKYKQEDYKRLHRYLTNTTTKHVWEVLSGGENPDEVFAGAPDEFHQYLRDTVRTLRSEHEELRRTVELEYAKLREELDFEFGTEWGRKEYAAKAVSSPHKMFLFGLLDGRDITGSLWEHVKPQGGNVIKVFSTKGDD